MTKSLFRSAVEGTDGEVDAGYLAIAGAFVIVLGAIPTMCAVALIEAVATPAHHVNLQELGIGIGSVCTGFGAVCTGVGVFRMGDKPK